MTLPHALPEVSVPLTSDQQIDRRATWVLFVGTLLVYAYFFGGQGYNQNAQFDAIRAVVERGTFEITAYADPGGPLTFTGDVYRVNGRIFSNKPPGMALIGAPVYAVIAGVERALSIDLNDLRAVRFNAYALTVLLSGLPGAWVVALLYRHLCENRFDPAVSALAAAGFAFGSLLFPYASVLMSHNLLAACLFAAWVWISRPTLSAGRAALTGLLVGLGVLTFLPVAPIAALFAAYLVWRRLTPHAAAFCIGPALAVVVMLAYNAYYYGSLFETGARIGGEQYFEPHLLLGYFDMPDPRRLLWITVHPYRGLLYCCPVFALCLLALINPDRAWLRRNIVPALIVALFILFYTSFNGWAGGFSVGPRYAIPALPFLFLFAVPAIARFRTIALLLIALSTLNMLAVTAYNVMVPGVSKGGPLAGDDPVAECYKRLTMNWVARNSESFNLGMLIGIKGILSALPALLLVGGTFLLVLRLTSSPRAVGKRRASESAR
jgi:hypothetical protein